ncbi:MAG: glutathione peroxidase [Betaproteobacteria bacterium]|nr:glutathione peroxidase [Betaproteobacteria bacterium]
MKTLASMGATALLVCMAEAVVAAGDSDCPRLLRHTLATLQGGNQDLCDYRGKVLLVVNTASFCGFTGQYEGLEALQRKFKDRGFVVLGFPSNDFGRQEPGSSKEIAAFCRRTYDVDFPMFEKLSVSGPAGNAFFRELTASSGESPQWNFHKYLIDGSGERVSRRTMTRIHHVAIPVDDVAWYCGEFDCRIAYQDPTWAMLELENLSLALVASIRRTSRWRILEPTASAPS